MYLNFESNYEKQLITLFYTIIKEMRSLQTKYECE